MAAGTIEGTTGRYPNLEVLRAVAALAILVGHAYGLGGRGVPVSAESAVDGVLMTTATGVWLFFCLSGLVIARPFVRSLVDAGHSPDLRGYAVRRAGRIYPLYAACAAALLLVVGTTGDGRRALGAHLSLLHNLVPGHQQDFLGVTWTLSLEVLFYAAIPVLFLLIRRRSPRPVPPPAMARWIVWSAVASMAWMLAGGALGDVAPAASLYGRLLLPAMWSAFCPGLLIAVLDVATPDDIARSPILRVAHRLRTDTRHARIVGTAAALTGFLSGYAQVEWGTTTYLWAVDLGRVAWSIAFGVLILRAIDRHDLAARTPRALNALGTWSYGLYLIHGTVLTMVLAHDGGSLVPMPDGGALAFAVHVLVVVGVTVPLSWLSWHVLERPAMRLARRAARPVVPVAPDALAVASLDDKAPTTT